MSTTDPSTETLEALRREAGEHGDPEQVDLCDRALDGDRDALLECARVIRRAEEMTR